MANKSEICLASIDLKADRAIIFTSKELGDEMLTVIKSVWFENVAEKMLRFSIVQNSPILNVGEFMMSVWRHVVYANRKMGESPDVLRKFLVLKVNERSWICTLRGKLTETEMIVDQR